MPKAKTPQHESVHTMRLDAIAAGAYYWFRAEGPDEELVSTLNRMRYRNLIHRFEVLNIPQPTSADILAYAKDKWPAHKLHLHGEGSGGK